MVTTDHTIKNFWVKLSNIVVKWKLQIFVLPI